MKNTNKKYYKIGEVAEILKVNTSVLRFWETKFSGLKPKKTNKGQRFYTNEDIDLLKKIKFELKENRLTIEGARKKIKTEEKEPQEKIVITRDLLLQIRTELVDLLETLKDQSNA